MVPCHLGNPTNFKSNSMVEMNAKKHKITARAGITFWFALTKQTQLAQCKEAQLPIKEGRMADIDADAGINLVSTHFDPDTYMFGVHDLVGDEVVVETEVAFKDMNLKPEQGTITTTTAATTVTAASTRPKAKGLDKGTGKMVEPEPVKKLSKKDQLMLDEELAFKLQAKKEEEERLAREKAQQIEEANIVSWDNVQAMIDANHQMAQQMQAEEQEKLSIEEKSKLFVQLLEARKKQFAAIRAKEKRKNPPTKAQKRNTMSTYLKNMAV
ncbi:hypothetical protein Tco_0381783 [Tanacetum coccineum]